MRLIPFKILLMIIVPYLVVSDHCYATSNKVLILGDSLSAAYQMESQQGWVSHLQQQFDAQKVTLINAAISGDTTDGGLSRLPRLLATHKPTHVYIELGGNDGLQGHTPKKIKQNLSQMISLVKASNAVPALQQMQIPSNYGPRYNALFMALYGQLAEQHSVTLIPFFLQEIALQPELMMRDGIHPNATAQPLIADLLFPHFESLLNTSAME